MHRTFAAARRLLGLALASSALALPLALPTAAQADPISFFVPYGGAGNVSVFSAAAGTGGWVGSIDQTPPPDVPDPLSFVSVVLFQLDASTKTLSGTFEFTVANDLDTTLYGTLTGSYDNADILTNGGQFSIDYAIQGSTGKFYYANGFGLAFVNYNPAGGFNNYSEIGLLNFSVPAPGTLALAGAGLLLAIGSTFGGATLRRRQPLNSAA